MYIYTIIYVCNIVYLSPCLLSSGHVLEMARRHAHHQAIGAQHRAARVPGVDGRVDLDAHQTVHGDVDA